MSNREIEELNKKMLVVIELRLKTTGLKPDRVFGTIIVQLTCSV